MAWLKEAMGGIEKLMELTGGELGGGYVTREWREAQDEAYKKVANLLASIAGVEGPYPAPEHKNNKEVNESE